MNSWQPVTLENCVLDGAPAACFPATWQALDWVQARGRPHPKVPAIMARRRKTGGYARLYCIAPDRHALGLAEGQSVFPVYLPNWSAVPTIAPLGWIWLLADAPKPDSGYRKPDRSDAPSDLSVVASMLALYQSAPLLKNEHPIQTRHRLRT